MTIETQLNSDLSPVLLFVYNRPRHTLKTLEYLLRNTMADRSDLIVFSDGARGREDRQSVLEVRRIIRSVQGFRSLTLVEREGNMGLAENITSGVSSVIKSSKKVIVLEDDLLTAPGFLEFMNLSLNRYMYEKSVWHISGWSYPIDVAGLEDAYFQSVMNCWGWATWENRWVYYRKNPNALMEMFSSEEIAKFNLEDSHNFWFQVQANCSGDYDTWAVFWYATIFLKNGLCLNPSKSLVENIGLDGSGEHCPSSSHFGKMKEEFFVKSWPAVVAENLLARERIINFYENLKPNRLTRALVALKRRLLG